MEKKVKEGRWLEEDTKRRISLMEDWVFDDKNAFMGSEVATASFVSKANEDKIYAASIR